MVVHNEEHGGVILWWGSKVPQSTVAQLLAFYNEQPDGSFGTPYPKLGSKVAITAWTGDPSHYQLNGYYGQGHIARLPDLHRRDEEGVRGLPQAPTAGKGPEGIPLSRTSRATGRRQSM